MNTFSSISLLDHPNQHCSQSGCERESLLPLNSTNVFAALGTLRKKKKSDKEQGSSKSKSSSKKKQDKESETQIAFAWDIVDVYKEHLFCIWKTFILEQSSVLEIQCFCM
ncbi:hypothetical protein LOK49_LG08G02847 [Camellia lanceoleosa]|uniref:Uncharacterized protein n=1 Tax=Camellia lanceoleosa TaxID=1840588 RepID=A0ACC0GVV1_9ERIC|nr:hypothetical protein LOK49_LG08G02847 [Camellia lanceoleosa]